MLLSFDIGTTGNKAALVDLGTGQIVGTATASYPTRYTPDGGAEQEPADWWASVRETCHELFAHWPHEMAQVDAVGCSGMMNGVVLIDGKGESIRPAIIHADTRSHAECRDIESLLGRDAVFHATSNRPDPHLTLPKVLWLAKQEPQALARAAFVVQAKDYIAGKLTGVWGVSDPSDASLTGAYRVRERRWATDLWQSVGLPVRLLPNVVSSDTVIGQITPEAAAWTGLTSGIPLVMGGGDGACATAGAGVARGEAYVALGGTSWIGLRLDAPLSDNRLSAYCSLDATVTCFGTVQAAGSAIEWVASLLGNLSPSALDALAFDVPPGARNLFFLPYLQGERAPLWDADARGVFFGLSTYHGPADLYRAALEGVGYALRSIVDVFAERGEPLPSLRLLGGGASSALWQAILASIFQRPTQTVTGSASATSSGAAMAAGVGIGVYPTWDEALAHVALAPAVRPDPALANTYASRYAFSQTPVSCPQRPICRACRAGV